MAGTTKHGGRIFGGIALALLLALAIALSGCTGPPKPSANIQLHLDSDTIKTGTSTTLRVTSTNDGDVPVDGTLDVVALKGSQYVSITTTEQNQITLPSRGSSVVRIYTVAGTADLQVVPVMQATIKNKDGTIAGQREQTITISP